MFTTVRSGHTSFISHNHHFVLVMVRTLRLYCRSNFGVCSAVLTILTMLYTRSPELTQPVTASLYSLTNTSPFSPPLRPWQPPFYFVSRSLIFSDSTYKRDRPASPFLRLTSLSIMPSRSVHLVTGGGVFFFFVTE